MQQCCVACVSECQDFIGGNKRLSKKLGNVDINLPSTPKGWGFSVSPALMEDGSQGVYLQLDKKPTR